MDTRRMAEQRLILSQRMIQSTEILQMNTQELTDYLKRQEMENPLVELVDNREEAADISLLQRKLEWLNSADEQNRVYYREEFEEEQGREAWNVFVEEDDLAEYVYAQLLPYAGTSRDEEILYYMAHSLDSRGYLTEDIRSIARRFGIGEPEASRYLYLLQSADPAGVGARNLGECLLIQLDRMPQATPAARRIVMECMELLGRNQLAQIGSVLGLSMEEVTENCRLVQSLNPKPGSGFSDRENLRYIQPDVTVVKFRDYFQVMLNDSSYPAISVNACYSHMLEDGDTPEETREYIRNKLNQAEWLRQCVDRRGETLTAVTKAIVELQRPFFESGAGKRQPMQLKDVSEKLGIHEMTVSRAIRDKYVQCSWGIFPMNYFFPRASAVPEGSTSETPERIRAAIRRIVDEEDKRRPLSDQKITDRLADLGFRISRRTVAKYRASMEIREAGGRKSFD